MKKLSEKFCFMLTELELIRYKKPVDKPKYSVNMLRYALLLRYPSVQAYKLWLQKLEETYSRWNWAIESGQSLIGTGKNWHWCCFVAWWGLFTKRFKITRWETISRLVLARKKILYKSVMKFMINSLKKSIPFVMKAIPEIKKRMPFRTHW